MNLLRAKHLLKRLEDYSDYMKKESVYLKRVIKEIKMELRSEGK